MLSEISIITHTDNDCHVLKANFGWIQIYEVWAQYISDFIPLLTLNTTEFSPRYPVKYGYTGMLV